MRIVVHDGLFKPHQIIRLEAFAPAYRSVVFHQTIGIRHQFDPLTHRLSHRFDSGFVLRWIILAVLRSRSRRIHFATYIEPSHLNFEPRLSVRDPILRRFRKFVASVRPESESDIGRNRLLRSSKESPYRSVVKLALDVP